MQEKEGSAEKPLDDNGDAPLPTESSNEEELQAEEDIQGFSENTNDKLIEAENKLAEQQDAWLRAKAEMENVKKRAQTDVLNAHKYGSEALVQTLLPVKDSLEAALLAQNSSIEVLRSGIELTIKQLENAFSGAKIKEIDPLGEKLNPNHHQAMGAVESDKPANTVIEVLQKGYLLNDRLVRPALVNVAKKTKEED